MDKGPDAFRTISEVADDLDIPQHVLRFWETRFSQIKPLKRGGGRRYYRPDDVDLLKGIRHLLYGEGYTIKGVQRILREEGVRFVQGAWHGDVALPQRRQDDADEAEHDQVHGQDQHGQDQRGQDQHGQDQRGQDQRGQARGLSRLPDVAHGDAPGEPADRPGLRAPAREQPAHGYAGPMRTAAAPAAASLGFAAMAGDRVGPSKRPEMARAPLFEREPPAEPPAGLSADDCHRLELALAELAECRRILGLARRADAAFDESTD